MRLIERLVQLFIALPTNMPVRLYMKLFKNILEGIMTYIARSACESIHTRNTPQQYENIMNDIFDLKEYISMYFQMVHNIDTGNEDISDSE